MTALAILALLNVFVWGGLAGAVCVLWLAGLLP